MITPRRAWLAVTAMFVLNGALFGLWASRIPSVAAQHDMSHGVLGLVLLCLTAGALCGMPVAGLLTDRIGSQRVIRWTAMTAPVSLILIPVMPHIVLLGAGLFLFGVLLGSLDVAMNAWAAEVERCYNRSFMSSFHAMFSLGAGIGAITGYFAGLAGLDAFIHFIISIALIAPVTIWLASVPWRGSAPDQNMKSGFVFPKGALLMVSLIAFAASMGEGAVADWSAVYLTDITSASEGQAALAYAAFSAMMVITRLIGDQIITHIGQTRATQTSGIFALTGCLIVVLASAIPLTIIGFALMGMGYAMIIPIAFSRAANDPDIPPGQGIAGVALLGYSGMLFGPPAIGFIAELTALPTAFLVLAALSALMIPLASSLRS